MMPPDIKRPEQIPGDPESKRLLVERLKGQHDMMEGSSADLTLLDRYDRADWPEIPSADTESDILPDGKQ